MHALTTYLQFRFACDGLNDILQVEGIPLSTLMGTVGGNLGMFVGMSMMTIIEWLEVMIPKSYTYFRRDSRTFFLDLNTR